VATKEEQNIMRDETEPTSLAEITVEIVSAYVAHNQVAASDLAKAISTMAGELRALGRELPEAAVSNKFESTVPVRHSVRRDHLVCLIRGKRQKVLKRHLVVEHELTPNRYRKTLTLKPSSDDGSELHRAAQGTRPQDGLGATEENTIIAGS
jgi:predicted transcriptional regulator